MKGGRRSLGTGPRGADRPKWSPIYWCMIRVGGHLQSGWEVAPPFKDVHLSRHQVQGGNRYSSLMCRVCRRKKMDGAQGAEDVRKLGTGQEVSYLCETRNIGEKERSP